MFYEFYMLCLSYANLRCRIYLTCTHSYTRTCSVLSPVTLLFITLLCRHSTTIAPKCTACCGGCSRTRAVAGQLRGELLHLCRQSLQLGQVRRLHLRRIRGCHCRTNKAVLQVYIPPAAYDGTSMEQDSCDDLG